MSNTDREVVKMLTKLFEERGQVIVKCVRNARYLQTQLRITLTDAQILDMFRQYFSGSITHYKGSSYEWHVTKGSWVAADMMLQHATDPLLRMKLALYQLAREEVGLPRGSGSTTSGADLERRRELCKQFKMIEDRWRFGGMDNVRMQTPRRVYDKMESRLATKPGSKT